MSNNNSIAIRLTKISKRYTIHHEKPTLVERLTNGKDEEFWALNDINLTIKKGERVGIIGPNGSGKTTLLKVIAGITTPTSGTVETHGRAVSLIGLEAGFEPDLSGIENIYLCGMLLGMKKVEIEKKIDSIIDFADIKQFIDAPMFTYSEGLKLRLGFAVAIHADSDIFLVDELIMVGDGDFRIKSLQALKNMKKTVVFASHDFHLVHHLSHQTLFMEGGINQTPSILREIKKMHSLSPNAVMSATVQSESMSNLIKKGDTIVMKKIPFSAIRRGDIVSFSFPNFPLPMVHRVAEISHRNNKRLLLTKGDASVGYDAWRVEKTHYLGKVIEIKRGTD